MPDEQLPPNAPQSPGQPQPLPELPDAGPLTPPAQPAAATPPPRPVQPPAPSSQTPTTVNPPPTEASILPAASPAPIGDSQPPSTSPQPLTLHALRYSKTLPEPVPTTPPPIPTGDETLAEESFARPPEPGWRVALKAVGVFLMTFVLVFALLQSQALIARARYFLNQPQDAAPTQLAQLPKLQDRPVTVTDIKNRPQDYLPSTAQLAGYTLADLGDNQLLIPKITVNAPIVWNPAPDENSMLLALREGVARYNFTALPTDGRGNIFITGHSSSPLWDPGQYKTVFANLDRLSPGDQLAISYQGIVYIYEVTGSRVVKPDDTSVLDQTDEPTLSLMTCVPVGTALNRLVVTAKLVSAGSHRPVPVPPPALTDPASIFHYLPF